MKEKEVYQIDMNTLNIKINLLFTNISKLILNKVLNEKSKMRELERIKTQFILQTFKSESKSNKNNNIRDSKEGIEMNMKRTNISKDISHTNISVLTTSNEKLSLNKEKTKSKSNEKQVKTSFFDKFIKNNNKTSIKLSQTNKKNEIQLKSSSSDFDLLSNEKETTMKEINLKLYLNKAPIKNKINKNNSMNKTSKTGKSCNVFSSKFNISLLNKNRQLKVGNNNKHNNNNNKHNNKKDLSLFSTKLKGYLNNIITPKTNTHNKSITMSSIKEKYNIIPISLQNNVGSYEGEIMNQIKSNLPDGYIHYLNFSYNDFQFPSKNQTLNTSLSHNINNE